jgi:hypothetical protein
MGEAGAVTELVEQDDGAVDAGCGLAVEQHGRWPAGAGEAGSSPEGHRAGDGPTDDDHHGSPRW